MRGFWECWANSTAGTLLIGEKAEGLEDALISLILTIEINVPDSLAPDCKPGYDASRITLEPKQTRIPNVTIRKDRYERLIGGVGAMKYNSIFAQRDFPCRTDFM